MSQLDSVPLVSIRLTRIHIELPLIQNEKWYEANITSKVIICNYSVLTKGVTLIIIHFCEHDFDLQWVTRDSGVTFCQPWSTRYSNELLSTNSTLLNLQSKHQSKQQNNRKFFNHLKLLLKSRLKLVTLWLCIRFYSYCKVRIFYLFLKSA